MNTSEFLQRINADGRYVVSSFGSLKNSFERFKRETINDHNQPQMAKLEKDIQNHETAVKDLKRMMDISQDPRYNRRY